MFFINKCRFQGMKNLTYAMVLNQVMVFVSLLNAKLWKNLTLGNDKGEKHCCYVFSFMIGQWLRSCHKDPRTSYPVTFKANRQCTAASAWDSKWNWKFGYQEWNKMLALQLEHFLINWHIFHSFTQESWKKTKSMREFNFIRY